MNESDLLNKMADIELPAPPDWQPFIIAICVTLLMVLAVVLIIWQFTRRSNKQDNSTPVDIRRSSSVLDNIETQWSAGRITDREASYQLSSLLRLGLSLSQFNADCPAGITSDATTWKKTIQLFNQLRYKNITQTKLSQDEFNNVKRWLMQTVNDGQPVC